MKQKPIIGKQSRGEEIHSFRERKLELKANDYPVEETKLFVKPYFEKIAEVIKAQVDDKTLLIKVPSGSGENMITLAFAAEVSRLTGAKVLPELDLISKGHKMEAKKNLALEKRNTDPIHYNVKGKELREIVKGYNKVIVLDDLIGSGESSIRLVKALEREKIKVDGLLNLITVEKRYPTPADFSRVYKKIHDHAKLVMSDSIKLKENLKIVFSDYTRQKLNRFERPINDQQTAIKAFKILSQSAAIEKKFGNDRDINLGL